MWVDGTDTDIALPHLATQDDEYHGYHIPAGTTIVANVWYVFRPTLIVTCQSLTITASRRRLLGR